MLQVVHGGGPHDLVAAAVGGLLDVVGAVDIDAELPGMIRILKDIGFAVRDVFPQGKVRVGGAGGGADQEAGAAQQGGQTGKQGSFHIAF